MRKLLFFTLLTLTGLNVFAQLPYDVATVGWEARFGGYTEQRGIKWISVLNDTSVDVAWTVAYDSSGNDDDICALAVTTDGGDTWTAYDPVDFDDSVNPGVSMVCPTSATTAYLAAYGRGGFSIGGLWKTEDTGATWTRINTSSMYTDAASFPNLIYFFDQNTGFSQGDPVGGEFEMYYTTDAGASWTPIGGANIDDPLTGEYGYTNGYAVAGSSFWFTTNKGRIFRSTDQGQSWTAFQTPLTDFGGESDKGDIVFKDDNEGWILRGNGELYHSTDGGATWTQMAPNGLDEYSYAIAYIPGTTATLVVSGDNNLDEPDLDYGTKISYDGGENWERIIYYKFTNMSGFNYIAYIADRPNNNFFHYGLGFRDVDFGLSGTWSVQGAQWSNGDENDPQYTEIGDIGVFKFVESPDLSNVSVNENMVEELQVYPNPATDVVNVMAKNDIQSISIIDITGKEVLALNNVALNNANVNISNLESGVYMMKVVDNTNAQQTVKLVVK